MTHASGPPARRAQSHPAPSPAVVLGLFMGALSPDLAAHVAMAVHRHLVEAPRDGLSVPPELRRFLDALSSRAMQGQPGTGVDATTAAVQREAAIPARVVTYEEAGRLLCVSHRTVKRLVAAGDLPVTRVAGSARIRVVDVDAYLDRPGPGAQSA